MLQWDPRTSGLGSICLARSATVVGLPWTLGGLVQTLLIVQLLCTQCGSTQASSSPDTSSTKFSNSICIFGSLKEMKVPRGCPQKVRTVCSSLETPALQTQLPARGQSTVPSCSPGQGCSEVYPPRRDEDDSSRPFTALPPDEGKKARHILTLCCNTPSATAALYF